MKKIDLISYTCGAGAVEKSSENGPAYLKKLGLEKILSNNLIQAKWLDFPDIPSSASKLEIIEKFSLFTGNQIKNSLNKNHFPLVFGGDHSCAIGTWSHAVDCKQLYDNFGLIWIDAHMDSHTPKTSSTGNYHGMPLAALLGYGESSLVNMCSAKPKLNPKKTCIIGVRSYEPKEKAFLEQLGVKIFYMEDVHSRGFSDVFREAKCLCLDGTSYYGISFDIDAFDPEAAPGTGYNETGGLMPVEIFDVLQGIGFDEKLLALEIAEFDPSKDIDNKTASLIIKMLEVIFS